MKKIIVDKPTINGSYFKLVFCRKAEHKDGISLLNWIYLSIIEFLFGEELLEQLVVTAAYNGEKSKIGHLLHLNDMLPSGLLTNLFRQSIYQLLYYKYYRHYLFLATEATINESASTNKTGELDFCRDRFAMRHELLNQIIAFRRVYILQWIILNVTIDTIVFFTADLQSALFSALAIEGFRRLVRI